MIVVACLDDNNGMFFNNRRQSKDRVVIQDIIDMMEGQTLYLSPYSAELFKDYDNKVVADNFLDLAGWEDYCFVENNALLPYNDKIIEVVAYHWNRNYPSDVKLDLNLSKMRVTDTFEFVGYSHDLIRKETLINE